MTEDKSRAEVIQAAIWVDKAGACELIAMRKHLFKENYKQQSPELLYFIDGIENHLQNEKFEKLWRGAQNKYYVPQIIIDVFYLAFPFPTLSKSSFREHLKSISEKVEGVSELCRKDKLLESHIMQAIIGSAEAILDDKSKNDKNLNLIYKAVFPPSKFFNELSKRLKSKDAINNRGHKLAHVYQYAPDQPKRETIEKTTLCIQMVDKMKSVTGKPKYEFAADLIQTFRPDLSPMNKNIVRKAYQSSKVA